MSEQPQNTVFRTLRPVRIASLTGHIINIVPGEPKALPPSMHEEAYAAGCVPVDSPEHVTAPLVPSGEDREAALVHAIHQLIAENDDAKFKNSGAPKVAAMEEVFGFAVTAAETDAAFEKVKSIAMALNAPKEEVELEEDKD